jgi:hypothetical protein
MQHGDLAVSTRPHYVVVLEGVLCDIEDITVERRFRSPKVVGTNLVWLDLPMRRLATMRRRFPEVGVEIVTFTSEDIADFAAGYLDRAGIDLCDDLVYVSFDTWVTLLPWKDGLQTIYDSDPGRLDRYGQLGRAVTRGEDFI